MTAAVSEFAPAKINLALHVTGRAGDGYHLLDSLVAFADEGDWLHIEPAGADRLFIQGPFGAELDAGRDNLVLRALAALRAETGAALPGCLTLLEKNLPVSSGIGGGSADAAAALRAAAQVATPAIAPDVLARVAPKLGADVPVCLDCRVTRMAGIGETLTPLASFPAVAGVLVNPLVPVSTAAAFAGLGLTPGDEAGTPLPDLPAEGWRNSAELARWLAGTRNDLEAPACRIAPEIADVLDCLRALPDVLLARMSGSGATCFAIFDSAPAAHAAATSIGRDRPGWWVKPVRIGETAVRGSGGG